MGLLSASAILNQIVLICCDMLVFSISRLMIQVITSVFNKGAQQAAMFIKSRYLYQLLSKPQLNLTKQKLDLTRE